MLWCAIINPAGRHFFPFPTQRPSVTTVALNHLIMINATRIIIQCKNCHMTGVYPHPLTSLFLLNESDCLQRKETVQSSFQKLIRSDESNLKSGSWNPGILVPLARRYCLIIWVANKPASNLFSIMVSYYCRESFPPGINVNGVIPVQKDDQVKMF